MRSTFRWILLLFCGVCLHAAAQDFFLRTTGNDEHDGRSEASAWKTPARAAQQTFSPGDRLTLESGAEFIGGLNLNISDGGNAEKPVLISSSGEKPATILSGDSDGIFIQDSGVAVRNLIFKGSGLQNQKVGIRMYNDRNGADKRAGVRIEKCQVSGYGRAGIYIESSPEDKSATGFKNVLIEDCTVSECRNYGIWSYGPEQPRGSWKYAHEDITVRRCEVFNIPGDPQKHDNHSGNGILIGSVDRALIEYCCAHHCGSKNGSHDGGPVGIWSYCGRDVVIQYCEAYANRAGVKALDGGGFDLDGGMTRSILQYNYSHDNDGAGYLIYSYKNAPHEFKDNIVRFNISINDGRRGEYGGIAVGHHGDQNINTLLHNNLVIVSGGEKLTASALVTAQTMGLKEFNNVFIARKGAYLIGTWSLKPGTDLKFAGNAWLYEEPAALLHGRKKCASLEEWLKLSSIDPTTVPDTFGSISAFPLVEAPVCWPEPPHTLAKRLQLTYAGKAAAIDPAACGINNLPGTDFAGKKVESLKFPGPLAH
ncbi:MAG TPA: right-handed parallel beta-helix repeat-containing protein [Planctomycetota bacterium]|nr:right-handed parallel beta-helix repeat-containing protein [Planctomycetota bacterium]